MHNAENGYIAIYQASEKTPLQTSAVMEGDDGVKHGFTYDEVKIMAEASGYVDYEIIEYSAMPSESDLDKNWSFRELWRHDKTESANKISICSLTARDESLLRMRKNREALFIADVDQPRTAAMNDGASQEQANSLVETRRQALKAATDPLKALVMNTGDTMTPEEAAALLLPLELIK